MSVNSMDFDCTTLLATGLTVNDSQKTESFKLDVHRVNDSMPTSTFQAGGRLTGKYPLLCQHGMFNTNHLMFI